MYGFETIGNATLIVHDSKPVLATDPWIRGEPYFGSWALAHEIPAEQYGHITSSEYIWFSHGHPDHLNADSLHELSSRKFLLPDHVGGRIEKYMRKSGLNVRVLPTKEWVDLSPRVRVMCLPDYNQDAVLLVAMGDTLIINLNDGAALGYKLFIRELTRHFKKRYVLALRNYGDADMINLWDESGRFIPPLAASKPSVGAMYGRLLREFRATHTAPFSSFHRLQRKDSVWARKFSTPLAAHQEGFDRRNGELLPAFVRVDLERDDVQPLNPALAAETVKEPAEFGDDWAELLSADEFALCEKYFRQKTHLNEALGFINLRVGGRDNMISLNPGKKTGITFETPRNSLVKSVKWRIFDDLLIANFMKTTLHGIKSLYPDFTPYVAKYADNGLAQTEEELKSYFRAYRARSTALEHLLTGLREQAENAFRRHFSDQSGVFQLSRKIYQWVK